MNTGNDGEHTEKLRTSDAENDDQLLNTIEGRLANLNKLTRTADDQADEPEENDEPTPEEDDEQDIDTDDDQAGEDDDSGEPTPDEDDDSDKDGQEDKELPAAFLRAAIHRGWKEDDAKEFFKESPDAAIRTFQNCYMDVNNASREWAKIGKAKRDSDSEHIDASNARPRPDKIDVDKLAKDYDLDDAVVKQLREQQEALDSVEQQPDVQPQPNTAVDPNKILEIENFFNAETLSDYQSFYGTLKLGQNWNDLSGGQYDNRFAVLEQADLIILGANAANVNIDPLEALERAHMIVSEPIREQAIREGIKRTATKRKKSMTIRPSSGTRSIKKVASDNNKTPGTRSREELTTAVQEKLSGLFNH